MKTILEMKNICKSFSGNIVLDNVNFTLEQGDVHALVGVNGAGKSTLIKILNGLYEMDSGEIFVDGQKVSIKEPIDAEKLGIRFVHQELNVCQDLNVAENIFVGKLPTTKAGFYDPKATIARAQELIDRVQIDIRADAIVRNLRAAEKQIIEILKALTEDSKILVLDEPTSSLSEKEKQVFFDLLSNLKAHGVSFIFISHFLEDILQFSDRVTVLKDSKNNGEFLTKETTKEDLIFAMMGKTIVSREESTRHIDSSAPPVLELRHLSTTNKFEDINLEVKPGSIIGVCGLLGAGKSEIARAIFGMDEYESGEIYLNGEKIEKATPVKMMKKGVAMVTEDRKLEGFVPLLSIRENLSVSIIDKLCNKLGFVKRKKQDAFAEDMATRMTVKMSSVEQPVSSLSGGNQQKVVVGRCVASEPTLFLLDEPTRGVDVYAKSEIYSTLSGMADKGVAIMIFSSELEELLAVCDKIVVLKTGSMVGVINANEIDKGSLLAMIS